MTQLSAHGFRYVTMDSALPSFVGISALVWLPVVALAFGLLAGLFIEGRHRRRAQTAFRAADARAAKERERASAAERDFAAEKAALAPANDTDRHALTALARGCQELGAATDAAELARLLGRAVERTFQPAQFIVLVAADRESKEFTVAAAGGRRSCGWDEGARLSDSTGRIGLVARRRVTMDRREFDAEPSIVRDHLAATEPADFMIDVAAPVVVGGSVVAIVSVGGSQLPHETTRAGVEILAAHASAVRRAVDAAARTMRLANTDPMTGLGSKSWFVAEGAEAVYGCRAAEESAALVVFGIDDFKGYVARSGHEAGDLLLHGVAEVTKSLCADGVLLARWSGAEFVAFVPRATDREARVFADRVRAATSAVAWPNGALQPRGRLTMSAGIAFYPACGATLDDLIERAAENLVDARWTGDTTRSGSAAARAPATDAAVTVSAPRGPDPAPTT